MTTPKPEFTLRLSADSLASKWGFNDGEMPDHIWDYFEEIGRVEDVDWGDVLCRLVRQYLLPLLPDDLEVYELLTSHNPIRTDYWGEAGYEEENVPDIEVYVTAEQIIAVALED